MDLFGSDDDDDYQDEFAIADSDGYDDADYTEDFVEHHVQIRDLHPRFAESVMGHGGVEQALLRQWQENKLPNAYIFAGCRGIGKASLAYRFALFLLEKGLKHAQNAAAPSLFGDDLPVIVPTSFFVPRDGQTAKQFLAGSHPDMLVIEPEWDDKKGRKKTDITIDQTRKIGEFLSLRPVMASCKIVLIDSVDALNVNAANSILKWLEEPPLNSIFILISHRPGALLPTIRSRCRIMSFTPLDLPMFSSILPDIGVRLDADDVHDLFMLSGGSVGVAAHLHAHGVGEWLHQVQSVLKQAPHFPLLEVLQVAEVTARSGENMLDWDDVSLLLSGLLARIVRVSASGVGVWAQDDLLEAKESVVEILARQRPLGYWLTQWDALGALLHETGRLYLDKNQTMLRVMESLMGRRSLA